MNSLRLLVVIALLTMALTANCAESQIEEVVFGRVVAEGNRLTLNVGSRGCTTKANFRWSIKKEPGIGITNNYVLTLVQTSRDACKAIFDEGVDLVYDLKKELGIQGYDSYTLTNKIAVQRNGSR